MFPERFTHRLIYASKNMPLYIDTYINTSYLNKKGYHLFLFFRYVFSVYRNQILSNFNENKVQKTYSNIRFNCNFQQLPSLVNGHRLSLTYSFHKLFYHAFIIKQLKAHKRQPQRAAVLINLVIQLRQTLNEEV